MKNILCFGDKYALGCENLNFEKGLAQFLSIGCDSFFLSLAAANPDLRGFLMAYSVNKIDLDKSCWLSEVDKL